MCVYCGWKNVHFVSFVRKYFLDIFVCKCFNISTLKFAQIGFLGKYSCSLNLTVHCKCKQKSETILIFVVMFAI